MGSRAEDPTALRERLDCLQSTNQDLVQELRATSKRMQRLAASLGFSDAYEAQAEIDAANSNLTYRACFEQWRQLSEAFPVQQAKMKTLKDELELARMENMALTEKMKTESVGEFPLNADTATYVLTLLSDLPSLISTSLSCRFLYRVFKADSQSITKAVALNQVGPALPQALRLARAEVAGLLPTTVSDLPSEDSALSMKISWKEAAVLAKNFKTVAELEDLFSWKRKDRKSTISVLAKQESWRFQRALYRIMLMCLSYGMDSFPELRMNEDEYEPANYDKQRDFLEDLQTSELYEIRTVAFFLQDLGFIRLLEDEGMSSVLDLYDFDGFLLFLGPRRLLQCYKYRGLFRDYSKFYDDGPATAFITLPLKQVLADRDTSKRPDSTKTILYSVHGKGDLCVQCRREDVSHCGVNLVNDTCWRDLKGDLKEDVRVWSRRLWTNPAENKLRETLRDIDYQEFMHTLFDARHGKYRNWRKDDWTCRACLRSLWSDTLSIWWLEQKREAGVTIYRDCWYGYTCDRQSSQNHARNFNHICEPTRVDYDRDR